MLKRSLFEVLFTLLFAFSGALQAQVSEEAALAPLIRAYEQAETYLQEKSNNDVEKVAEFVANMEKELQKILDNSQLPLSAAEGAYGYLVPVYESAVFMDQKRFLPGYQKMAADIAKRVPQSSAAEQSEFFLLYLDLSQAESPKGLEKRISAFTKAHPRSRYLEILFDSLFQRLDKEEALAAIESYRKEFRSPDLFSINEKQLKQIGSEIPFSYPTLTGETFDLKKQKGKVVLIDLWATWCGRCVQMTPGLIKLYEQNKNRGLEIVGVNGDEDRATLEKYLKDHGVTWPQIPTADVEVLRAISNKFQANGLPVLILIGRDGKVASVVYRDFNLMKAKLLTLLAE